jgi:hypothetical protein
MRIESDIGPYLANNAKKNLKSGLPLVVISYLFMWIVAFDWFPIHVDIGKLTGPSCFISGLVFTYGLYKFIQPYHYWKNGLNGERKVVSNISGKLGNEHSLFNDVMLRDGKSGGNIDHIIVGPRGIFAIETKNIQGIITIYEDNWKGQKNSPSSQAKNNARRVYRLLNNSRILDRQLPLVQAIVVLTNNKAEPKIEKTPEMCKIIQIKDQADSSLYDYIMSHEDVVLSTEEIGIIVEFLKDVKLKT